MDEELSAHLADIALGDAGQVGSRTIEFKEAVVAEKAKSVPASAPHTAGLWTQVKACTARQYQLMWNDRTSIMIKQGSCVVQSIILGSLFCKLRFLRHCSKL